jgi:TetR/AcrR family transcriptional repressor of nem operon
MLRPAGPHHTLVAASLHVTEGKVMPYSPDHKEHTRNRILRNAARLFNRKGFSEATIGEIMTAAGLTHGGFYRHFSSKDKLYAEAVRHFLCKDAPEPWQRVSEDLRKTGQPFARFIVDAYLSRDHLNDRDGSCPLIGLPSDVARSSKTVKAAYRGVAESMIQVFEANLNGPKAHERALVVIALCVGGMVLARAMDDQALANDLRDAAHKHVLMTAGWGEVRGH